MRAIVGLFLLTMTICHAEIIGERAFSVPEIWFDHFQVPVPRGEDHEAISSITHCDKITPFVRYQLDLSYSEKDGISARIKIVQDPTITIQYFLHKSSTEPVAPFLFLTVKNIKGSVQLSGSFTQLGKIKDGKVCYHIALNATEQVSCDLGQFFRHVPNCHSGIYEVDLQSGKISAVQSVLQ